MDSLVWLGPEYMCLLQKLFLRTVECFALEPVSGGVDLNWFDRFHNPQCVFFCETNYQITFMSHFMRYTGMHGSVKYSVQSTFCCKSCTAYVTVTEI